jgi:hypothetical protein
MIRGLNEISKNDSAFVCFSCYNGTLEERVIDSVQAHIKISYYKCSLCGLLVPVIEYDKEAKEYIGFDCSDNKHTVETKAVPLPVENLL